MLQKRQRVEKSSVLSTEKNSQNSFSEKGTKGIKTTDKRKTMKGAHESAKVGNSSAKDYDDRERELRFTQRTPPGKRQTERPESGIYRPGSHRQQHHSYRAEGDYNRNHHRDNFDKRQQFNRNEFFPFGSRNRRGNKSQNNDKFYMDDFNKQNRHRYRVENQDASTCAASDEYWNQNCPVLPGGFPEFPLPHQIVEEGSYSDTTYDAILPDDVLIPYHHPETDGNDHVDVRRGNSILAYDQQYPYEKEVINELTAPMQFAQPFVDPIVDVTSAGCYAANYEQQQQFYCHPINSADYEDTSVSMRSNSNDLAVEQWCALDNGDTHQSYASLETMMSLDGVAFDQGNAAIKVGEDYLSSAWFSLIQSSSALHNALRLCLDHSFLPFANQYYIKIAKDCIESEWSNLMCIADVLFNKPTKEVAVQAMVQLNNSERWICNLLHNTEDRVPFPLRVAMTYVPESMIIEACRRSYTLLEDDW